MNRYSPMNVGNVAVGRDIKSSHLSHPSTLRKDIEITIKYHQRLEGKALYIGNVKPQEEVRIHFYPLITKSELLPLLLFLSHLTLPLETQWPTPYQWPLEWKFPFCSCAGHLTTSSDILSRRSPRLTILASSLLIHILNFVSIDCSLRLQTHSIK